MDWMPITKENWTEFTALTDFMRNGIQGLQNMGQFDVCSMLTSVSVHKLPKITQTA